MARICALTALAFVLVTASAAASSGTETRLDFSVCPNITATIYPQTPNDFDARAHSCGPPVLSANDAIVPPNGPCQLPGNTDLGAFDTTQSPFGVFVNSGVPNNCSTNPPTLGRGAGGAALDASVVQRGFCPTTLAVSAHQGGLAGIVFPLGTLPLGTYDVTVTFPPQTATDGYGVTTTWAGVSVHGVLRVGAKFTETDAHALVTRNTFGSFIHNSFAGIGAGDLASSKSGNTLTLTGTDFYACGTIDVKATVTLGKRGAMNGNGSFVGGTGNYENIKGDFTLRGRYNTKTNRGTFRLSGEAAF